MQTLTADQVRATIEAAGNGESFKARLRDVAARTECGEATLYNYLRDGSKRGPANVLLRHLAFVYEIIERPDDGGGVMII